MNYSLGAGAAGPAGKLELKRRYPTVAYLRAQARAHVPGFAVENMDGGRVPMATLRTTGTRSTRRADRLHSRTTELPPLGIELCRRPYAAPINIAPIGRACNLVAGADRYLAEAAQRARIPYTLGAVGGIQPAAKTAPDVLWFQLYRFAGDGHRVGFDLVRRGDEAGVHGLMLTLDVPVRTSRPREVAGGITTPLRPDLAMAHAIAASPGWLMALWRNGHPRFSNLLPYTGSGRKGGVGQSTTLAEAALFARTAMGGAFTFEEIARRRARWRRPLVVKRILLPQEQGAEKAVSLGVRGVDGLLSVCLWHCQFGHASGRPQTARLTDPTTAAEFGQTGALYAADALTQRRVMGSWSARC